ncbi:hypothetical protein DB30_04617 [Enhygromyxa salina]|uniref:Radical SAM core domain-containing protein n=1 Tax=Enhygromyxa salina TaxID=215803 RepID=A0A0C2DHH6_9BACT|nr:radical SAM protein [Enhygromyxa salina]KIG19152.1 hypothetical protein DB30_04617 [Enhygromyxa salina]
MTSAPFLRVASVEFNLTEHCNLSCYGCDHASPLMAKAFLDHASFCRDLDALAGVMRTHELKLLGGEPLLHPDLLEFIATAKASPIAECVTVVTNGVLLDRVPEPFWALIDRLWWSVYPGVKYRMSRAQVEARAEAHGFELFVKDTPNMRVTLLNHAIDDDASVQMIYDNCPQTHEWSCHTVHAGRYYKCSPAPWMQPRLRRSGVEFDNREADSIPLHANPRLREQLEAYLRSPKPLQACRYCLSNFGREVPGRQLNKKGLRLWVEEDHRDWLDLVHPEFITTE